MFSIENNGK